VAPAPRRRESWSGGCAGTSCGSLFLSPLRSPRRQLVGAPCGSTLRGPTTPPCGGWRR
jgi:hypothetical protein